MLIEGYIVKAYIESEIEQSISTKREILSNGVVDVIQSVSVLFVEAFRRGNRVIFAGNGGSAADAQHLAAEFVSRFAFDRPGLPSISLATDTSMITAIGNDYGFENLFARQLQAQARSGDVFVGITTSGKSPNVIRAFEECREIGVIPVALCGESGDLDDIADYVIRVPSKKTARIQESHILIGHILCGSVEEAIFGRKDFSN